MTERWAADLAEAIRKGAGSGSLGGGVELLLGKIDSASPLRLLIDGAVIKENLYRNPDYTAQAGDDAVILRQGDSFMALLKVVPAS